MNNSDKKKGGHHLFIFYKHAILISISNVSCHHHDFWLYKENVIN